MNVFSIKKLTDTASTITTLLDCLSMLRKLLSLCHGSSKHIDTMPVDSLEEVDDVLLDILISSTSHDAYLIRDISKYIWKPEQTTWSHCSKYILQEK